LEAIYVAPQQLPGTQPVWDGLEPQQVLPAGIGSVGFLTDMDDADIIFSSLLPLHDLH
jgi:hypothetical protein